jgi:molybdenum cofactor cytidylyltransferase
MRNAKLDSEVATFRISKFRISHFLMVSAILLAAGESRRMGDFKQLLRFAGKTFVESCVDSLLASRVDEVVVVTGYRHRDVRNALGSRPVRVVHNSEYEFGMSSSVKCGVEALPLDTQACLIALVDQPQIRPDIINQVLDAYLEHRPLIVIPNCNGRNGHPIIVDLSLRSEILTMDAGRGLRQVVHAHTDRLLLVGVDSETVLIDFDLPEDYERLSEKI